MVSSNCASSLEPSTSSLLSSLFLTWLFSMVMTLFNHVLSLGIINGRIIIMCFSLMFILKALQPLSSICSSMCSRPLLTSQFYSHFHMVKICHSSIPLSEPKSVLIFCCCCINLKLIQIYDLSVSVLKIQHGSQ